MNLKVLIYRIIKLFNQKGLAIKLELLHWFKFLLKKNDLIILDDLYPHPISTFRNIEFNEYLRHFKNVEIHSSGDALSSIHEKRSIKKIIETYSTNNITKIYNHHRPLKAKLLYSIFLCNIYGYLEVIERNKIPFVFTLYPGGLFLLDSPESDKKLRRVFESKYFKKVIVTQKITKEYLLKHNFCNEAKIEFIYGVVSPPIDENIWNRKLKYGIEKSTIDICFVANKQMKHGLDKGYDLFIESMKLVQQEFQNVQIHIVGPYDATDYETNQLHNIHYHGFISHAELHDFFLFQDIIVSPNRAFVLRAGSFDGFPTAACTEASANGVAMFVSDPLKQNMFYSDLENIVIIDENPEQIAKKLIEFISDINKTYELAHNGLFKFKEIYSFENQLKKRIDVLNNIINSI